MTPEEQKNKLYEYLGREFKPVEEHLDAEGTVTLDGVLWKLAGKLQEMGAFIALGFVSIVEEEAEKK